jgi:hypothetical protein
MRNNPSSITQSAAKIFRSTPIRLAALGFALLLSAQSARADLVLEAPTFNATPGSSGKFDLLITNNGSTPVELAADGIELGVPAGIHFTAADITTATPYVFPSSFDDINGFTLSLDPFPTTDFTVSDVDNAPSSSVTINPGDTFGIADISYTIDPTAAPGNYELSFEHIPPATSLSDAAGHAIPFTTSNGSINVIAATPVPLPSPLGIGLTLIVTGLATTQIGKHRHKPKRS